MLYCEACFSPLCHTFHMFLDYRTTWFPVYCLKGDYFNCFKLLGITDSNQSVLITAGEFLF